MQTSRTINQNTKLKIIEIISGIWDKNYTYSLNKMKQALLDLEKTTASNKIIENIQKIALDICWSRIEILKLIGYENQNFEKKYHDAEKLIENSEYDNSFEILQDVFSKSDNLIKGRSIKESEQITRNQNTKEDYFLIWFFIIILLIVVSIIAIPIKLILK